MLPVKLVTPTGCIGNRGIHKETFLKVIAEECPDAVASDAGSLDPGPWFLGFGREHSPMRMVRWDLEMLLSECVPRKIPVIIGSAGGSGASAHVDTTLEIIYDIAKARGLKFRLAVIRSDVSKEYLRNRVKSADIKALDREGSLSLEDVEKCNAIVAMMGVEPMIKALDAGADVVIAGRATDCGTIAAYPIWKGADKGLALHMGDIMECGEAALVEREKILRSLGPNRIPIIGEIFQDCFLIKSGNPSLACTPQSAAAHAMYEQSSIFRSIQPGGVLDRTDSEYEKVDEFTTKISKSKFIPHTPYTVLLEGVAPIGYRSVVIVGIRTPRMIKQIETILEEVRATTLKYFGVQDKASIFYHIYGKNSVLKDSEFIREPAHELGVVFDIIAESQELAFEMGCDVRMRVAFCRYEGRQTTAGNCAVLFSPSVIDAGQAFELKIFHSLPLHDPCKLFPMEIQEL